MALAQTQCRALTRSRVPHPSLPCGKPRRCRSDELGFVEGLLESCVDLALAELRVPLERASIYF